MKDNIYSQDFVEKVKSKNDIVSIIGKYVRLEKKGKNYWACCPFHHEKTPSFSINEYEQFYHCFGCGESGDVITFLRKYENMEYGDVIKMLAENAGMEIPIFENDEKYHEKKKLKDKCLEILALSKNIYKENIYSPLAKPAQEYIKKRKLTKKELDNFELGYSLDAFQIVNKLKERKFTNDELKASGVCEIGKSGKPYDFLTERLVFPIINANGDCIGFSGRDLKNSGMMKYKNTSATIIFDKSRAIYGINLIKKLKQASGLNNIILVEGQFDVITMHRYGFTNTVACLGTAITKEHIRELKRFTDKVILCLDGDSAGQKATLRTLDVFENTDVNLKVAIMPNGQDPDEYLSQYGADALQKNILDKAVSPMDFKIFMTKNKFDINTTDGKSAFVKEILKEISKIPSNSEREIYLSEIKDLTNISIDILRRDVSATNNSKQQSQQLTALPKSEQDASVKAIKFILASMLFGKEYAKINFDLTAFIVNPTLKHLYQLINEKEKEGKKLIVSSLFDIFDVETEQNIADIINFNFEKIENEKIYFENCLWQVLESELKFRKSELSKQYSEEIDSDKKKILLNNIAKIDAQLKNKNLGDFIDE